MPFLNREREIYRLKNAFGSGGGTLIVIYGRRRCGKSRLLQQIRELRRDVYYLADMRDGVVQREALAHEIARVVPRFDDVLYPDWTALLEAWMDRAVVRPGKGDC